MTDFLDLGLEKPGWWKLMNTMNLPWMLVNSENRVIAASDVIEGILGFDENEVVGQTLVDITHEDDRAKETKAFMDIFYGMKSSTVYSKQFIDKDNKAVTCTQVLIKLQANLSFYALVLLTTEELGEEVLHLLRPALGQFDLQPT